MLVGSLGRIAAHRLRCCRGETAAGGQRIRLLLIRQKIGSGRQAGQDTTEDEVTSQFTTIHKVLLLFCWVAAVDSSGSIGFDAGPPAEVSRERAQFSLSTNDGVACLRSRRPTKLSRAL